ncbi:hypothetical protein DN432_10235 [Lactobacillus reuteri]|uniref:hypothetical protein n=1 Tax=Limosilactobacillus reuteri TaxID=1598 RepID=UPI00128B8115|nr:hypothetical protein [Limosilactobacillus reuteri]MQB94124.1 hypothetical protein [Limosilactobacillus reuteri]
MSDKQTLIYWVDLTGPAPLDEIVRLTIMDTNDNVLFNHTFNTKLVDWWYSELNGIKPEETYNEQQFENYKNKIQTIFNHASKLITFNASNFFLEKQGITIPTNTAVEDLADPFRVLGDANDTIDNLCTYYGYDLPVDIHNRTGIDYAKAVNHCWHEMNRYCQAQKDR